MVLAPWLPRNNKRRLVLRPRASHAGATTFLTLGSRGFLSPCLHYRPDVLGRLNPATVGPGKFLFEGKTTTVAVPDVLGALRRNAGAATVVFYPSKRNLPGPTVAGLSLPKHVPADSGGTAKESRGFQVSGKLLLPACEARGRSTTSACCCEEAKAQHHAASAGRWGSWRKNVAVNAWSYSPLSRQLLLEFFLFGLLTPALRTAPVSRCLCVYPLRCLRPSHHHG